MRLKRSIRRLRLRSDEGTWVVPSQGVHALRPFFPLDLIYLDDQNRVINLIESIVPLAFGPIRTRAGSVLELPSHTIYSTNTQIGDQMMICVAEEMSGHLAPAKEKAHHGARWEWGKRRPEYGRSMRAILEGLTSSRSRKKRRKDLGDNPPLVAHYWDGGAPLAHKVQKISSDRLYLVTDQRWYPGTLVMLSLQREDVPATDPNRAITVKGQVVGADENGVFFLLVLPEKKGRDFSREVLPGGADKKTFRAFLKRLQENRGQALIAYALILPLVFLLIVKLINLGGFFFAWIRATNAREGWGPIGTRYATVTAESGQDLTSMVPGGTGATEHNSE
ncbi:DUF192 domain-containing protein [Terriglobus sp. 2YAB30_2]